MKFALAVLAALLASACSSNNGPNCGSEPRGSFTLGGGPGTVSQNLQLCGDWFPSGGTAKLLIGRDYTSVTLQFPYPPALGTLHLGGAQPEATAEFNTNLYGTGEDGNGDYYETLDAPAGSGTITITTWDAASGHLAGTFSFSAPHSGNDNDGAPAQVVITDGQFDLNTTAPSM